MHFAQQVTLALRTNWDRSTFDYLVNNAGTGGFSLLQDTTEADFDPGAIRTEFAGSALDNPELAQTMAAMTALGRIGEAEDVALAIASLLSEDSRWMNGQSIEVSGGMNL